jgi:hypothetical protein
MKKILIIIPVILLLFLIGCKKNELKIISEDALVEMAINNKYPDADAIKLKNAEGHEISLDSLKTLEMTGEYFEDFYENEKGEIVELVIRERTAQDKILIARIQREMNKAPELETVEIDCADKVNILQNVFDRDQGMRQSGNEIDPQIDHANLEIIVSFIEKCGIPTLDEVDDVQMAGIWAVLQHAPAEYQSKYISLLEESAEKGDIKWRVVALMKDRALMYEGKPQIYGSQISNGKLHDLFEPEYVNQRRTEIGMEPIEVYLKRFDIEFTVEQKIK